MAHTQVGVELSKSDLWRNRSESSLRPALPALAKAKTNVRVFFEMLMFQAKTA